MTEDEWTLVDLVVERDAVEVVSDRLWSVGVAAVEELDGDGHVVLRTSVGDVAGLFLDEWRLLDGVMSVSEVRIDRTVADTWRAHATPTPVAGGIAIVPAWTPDAWDADARVLIEPGDAFGVGNHPTTVLAARLLLDVVRPGDRVYDFGCGTGVLAILASRHRGARSHVFDIAPGCRRIVEENCRLNGLTAGTVAWTPPEKASRHEVVVANILAPVLRAQAPLISSLVAEGGHLLLSGMREEQVESVVACYPGTVSASSNEDGWTAVDLRV